VKANVMPGERLPRMEVPVTARMIVFGAAASRDWQPQHHDHAWAVARAGARDIFLNTPTLAGWLERYLTDWTGPYGRLGRLTFKMRKPMCVGDTLVFDGVVDSIETGWVNVALQLTVDGEVATEGSARVAVPSRDGENPWVRERWDP
jgi:acyl dehydratase